MRDIIGSRKTFQGQYRDRTHIYQPHRQVTFYAKQPTKRLDATQVMAMHHNNYFNQLLKTKVYQYIDLLYSMNNKKLCSTNAYAPGHSIVTKCRPCEYSESNLGQGQIKFG